MRISNLEQKGEAHSSPASRPGSPAQITDDIVAKWITVVKLLKYCKVSLRLREEEEAGGGRGGRKRRGRALVGALAGGPAPMESPCGSPLSFF